MTHAELVARGSAWLRRQGCATVLSEFCANTKEHPDCIGWRSDTSILIECKASRADFLADKAKSFRIEGGMGDFRLYLAPPGIIAPADLPEGWGLLIAKGSRIEVASDLPRAYVVESWGGKKRKCLAWWPKPFEGDKRTESILLLSALRRLQLHHGQAECDRLIHMTYADKEIAA